MYIMKTNIVNLRKKLSEMLDYVKEGNELEIQKRNVVIAKVIPVAKNSNENQTKLDVGKGTVKYYGDVTEPALEDDWEMHK
jgi:antitoxin (DNA-binding transcriptional repressor) of toxin-antitoxin stability system